MKYFLTALLIVFAAPNATMAGAKDDPTSLLEQAQPLAEQVDEVPDVLILKEKSAYLYEVLAQAYETNPELLAARAGLRAIEERLPQALANFHPTISGSAEATYQDVEIVGGAGFVGSSGDGVTKQAGIDVTQPIFRGGRTLAATRGAKNLIEGQRASLKALEQDVFTRAAMAYMDVLLEQAVVRLQENNRELITRQLEATQDRFTVGELTRTDVSQAQARLAKAEADLIEARADLRAAQSDYESIIGVWPSEDLLYPEQRLDLPTGLEDVLKEAITHNPEIIAADYLAAAADDDVDEIFGELLPSLSAVGSFDKLYDPVPSTFDEQENMTAGLRLTVPFYNGFSTQSRVREARETANQRLIEVTETKRSIRAQAIAAWEVLKAAQAQILSREAQVQAAAVAREGVNYETEFGERTVLDSLDAEQEYLDAQVELVTARRDEVVARFELAALLGRLTPENLGLFAQEKSEKPKL